MDRSAFHMSTDDIATWVVVMAPLAFRRARFETRLFCGIFMNSITMRKTTSTSGETSCLQSNVMY